MWPMGMVSTSPWRQAWVKGVSAFSTLTWTGLQTYFKPTLRISAPGSNPDSHKIWKPLQMPKHQPAAVGELSYRFHYRGKLGDGAGAQVIAVGKTAGNDDGVAVFEVMRLVPKECDRLLRDLLDGPICVVIAVRSGENDDAEFHPGFLAEGVIFRV